MSIRNYFGGASGYYGSSNKMNGHKMMCNEWAPQQPVLMAVVVRQPLMQLQPPLCSGFTYLDGTSRRFGPSRGFYKSRYFGPISQY
jgi:hypothetical protein